MYSGITQGTYEVTEVTREPGLVSYRVDLGPTLSEGLQPGASVSIDGVCQTVVSVEGCQARFDAIDQTLRLTTLGALTPGQRVSVERSLKVGDENGGHEVFGHVKGTGTVVGAERSENNLRLRIQVPKDWMRFILDKGFIAVDGSSLTVGAVDADGHFEINLIPETLRRTNFGARRVGDRVNVELDARTVAIVETVERVLAQRGATLG